MVSWIGQVELIWVVFEKGMTFTYESDSILKCDLNQVAKCFCKFERWALIHFYLVLQGVKRNEKVSILKSWTRNTQSGLVSKIGKNDHLLYLFCF